jgi:prophage antirepressor-like protein
MKNEIMKTFKNPEFGKVRTIMINDEPWFVGKDVADCLGYSNPQKAIRDHVDEEDKTVNELFTVNGTRGILVNESGLYSLILSSKLPTAKQFKCWITHDVIPTIRKTGGYVSNDDMFVNTYLPFADDNTKALFKNTLETVRKQNKLIAEQKPKAEYFDALVDRNLLTNFRDTAKELHIKQKDFVNYLLDNKYVYRDGRNKLKPFSDKTDLFEVKEYKNDNGWNGTQTLITPKGKETFRLLLEGDK